MECDEGILEGMTGSGKGVISLSFPSCDEVSTVICLVDMDCRNSCSTGEHLIAIDGFLWPGKCAIGGLFKPARL